LLSESDIPRFSQLGAIATLQFNFPEFTSDDIDYYTWLIGNRIDDMMPVNKLDQSGAIIAYGSDWDVSDLSPFVAIEYTATDDFYLPKKTKDERVAWALRGYTLNSAYAMHQEDRTGSVEVGKYADLIVIDQNLFEIPAKNIHITKVLLTLLAGKEVYRYKALRD